MTRTVPFLLLTLSACTCGSRTMTTTGDVTVDPTSLAFGTVYVGQTVTRTAALRNAGRASEAVALSIDAPFTVSPSEVNLGGGAEETLSVTLTTTEPGALSTTLKVGTLNVSVVAEVLAVPDCVASSPCQLAQFDLTTARCTESARAEGDACQTSCLSAGVCSRGECIGEAASCADQNACTLDVCGNTGCKHLPRECVAPSDPCLAAYCDPMTGCGSEPVPDGTLCGSDDCLATQLDVCIAGQCVQRPRPSTGRCTNTWVTTGVSAGPMAFDEARGVAVSFNLDHWLFNGQSWARRTPAQRPPAQGPMVYDSARKRVVLVTGTDTTPCETWEWDGVTWVRRTSTQTPGARGDFSMAYDVARNRTVLFGGRVTNTMSGMSNQTWEWDGRNWERRQPTASPPETAAAGLAYDPVRQRTVLFGGAVFIGNGSEVTNTTWEYDGTTWARAADGPPRVRPAMSFDHATRRILVQGGSDSLGVQATAGTWTWDGTSWTTLDAGGPIRSAMVARPDAGTLALDSRGETWEWDGVRWTVLLPRPAPEYVETAAWDPVREGIVSWEFGRTWLWDGAAFRDAGTGPSFLRTPRLFLDESRNELVVVAGVAPFQSASTTWVWGGASWDPGADLMNMSDYWTETAGVTFDSDRQVGVVVTRFTTWEYADGGWQNAMLAVPSLDSFTDVQVAHDRARSTTVLLQRSGATFERRDGGAWFRSAADAGSASLAQLTFDAHEQAVVGLWTTPAGTVMATYRGQSWVPVAAGRVPPIFGNGAALVYDPTRARLTYVQGPVVWVYLP